MSKKDLIKKIYLSESHPHLATEAFGWDCANTLAGSNKKKMWMCNKNHIFEATVASRAKIGTSCPYCSGRKPIKGQTDLLTTHPEIAEQADGWDPTEVKAGSSQKKLWRCNKGHSWQAPLYSRVAGNGCPCCSGLRVVIGESDLATTHPEIAEQADGWDPTEVKAGSSQKKLWRCILGHQWKASVYDRTKQKGTGCPYCSGLRVIVGQTDLKTNFPEIAKQAHGWCPSTVSFASNQKKLWICFCGYKWKSGVSDRTRHGCKDCPACLNKVVIEGRNDLFTTHPAIAMQAHGWNPAFFVAGSNEKKEWKCDQGHIWKTTIICRTKKNGTDCPYCSGNQVIVGKNDILTNYPEIAKEAYGWMPDRFSRRSGHIKKWLCEFGHVYEARIASRTTGSGCPYCSGHRVIVGKTDLVTTHPEIAIQAYNWCPTTVSAGSGQIKEWICDEGHVWSAPVYHRKKGTGCPSCAEYGFDPEKKSFFYLLMRNKQHKIGIYNSDSSRLKIHFKNQWRLLEQIETIDGYQAKQLETKIKYHLRLAGIPTGKKAFDNKFDGWTESWRQTDMSVQNMADLFSKLGISEILQDVHHTSSANKDYISANTQSDRPFQTTQDTRGRRRIMR